MEKQTRRDIQNIIISVLLSCLVMLSAMFFITKNNSNTTQTQTVNLNTTAENNNEKININTASLQELMMLNGIGEIKANAIINARPFNSITEIINVKGIGETTYNNIKEDITI